ncbi:MAG TPA: tetratricopeptide repeat protein [Steroidobacteraceae bacterium]|jgi:tetratricopeptide (TPR) repeat protein|nr:tetratricopeptide repeat protein [Steroidobacteraceae bacterium]
MRRLVWWQLFAWLCAAAAVTAQVQTPTQGGPAAAGPSAESTKDQAAPAPDQTKQQVTVTAPRGNQSLPELPDDEFSRCMGMVGSGVIDYTQAMLCDIQLSREKRLVVEACVNKKGDAAPARVIQACTESLDHNIYEGNARFFLFASRAAGYFAAGDKQHALEDYNEAVKLAPRNAYVYYNRGVFYSAQSDNDAALRDFDAAIGLNSNLVIALRQRARIYQARGNFIDAREDYSKAIGVEPKTAALWSERGYVSLRQKDYDSAVKDEAEAIRLDPKLARAYYLRGAAAAFGGLGDSHQAIDDIKTAVGLDPSLATYVRITDKTASLLLPPL